MHIQPPAGVRAVPDTARWRGGQYGCLVVNAPTANTVAAAEHGIALIAALSRNVAQADASVKAGRWERSKYVGVSIVGKTLAIMGFGKARWPHPPVSIAWRWYKAECSRKEHTTRSHSRVATSSQKL